MPSIVLRPVGGLRSNFPHDDPTLYQSLGGNQFATHAVDGLNIDQVRKRNSCSKTYGKLEYSNTANAQATKCMGLFELSTGSQTDKIFFDNGKMYVYDSSRDPVDKGPSGVTLANDNMDLYSMIRFGTHIVFTDFAEHTPYAWDNGDANAAKLINTGTEYKFRYLEQFQRRILGAYSDQTNGDIEIRPSNLLPVPITDCTFPAAAQIYVTQNESITGIKRMGNNACFVYGDEFIDRIDYYADYTSPFNCVNVVAGQGFSSHHSIVNAGGRHFGFNRHYGFCEFNGGPQFPAGGHPISEMIEDKIATMNSQYYGHIVGSFIPLTNEVAWTVPLDGASVPSHILYFNILTGDWRIENRAARYIDYWSIASDVTWTSLVALGFTTWESLGNTRWGDLASEVPALVMANTDGKLYYHGGHSIDGSDFEGYRIEPMVPLNGYDKSVLNEIWFWPSERGDYSIDVYYRGGNTESETRNKNWSALDSISVNDPADPVTYTHGDEGFRFHQIKWGTDAQNEPFSVNAIELKYEPLSRY